MPSEVKGPGVSFFNATYFERKSLENPKPQPTCVHRQGTRKALCKRTLEILFLSYKPGSKKSVYLLPESFFDVNRHVFGPF